jgi:hypothetical protein
VAKKANPAPATPAASPWFIELFQRHRDDDPTESVPGQLFLDAIPTALAARILAVVKAVADAPPPAFSGGGMWEAMHGEMAGIYEVRVDHKSRHHRLFCVLERDGARVGLNGPSLVILAGLDKPFRTKISGADYEKVRALRDEYAARNPRSVVK